MPTISDLLRSIQSWPSTPRMSDVLFGGGSQPDYRYTYGGVPVRQATESESNFFGSSGVPAYSSPDGAVVHSPFSNLNLIERAAIEKNEAARVWMNQNQMYPNFQLTPAQSAYLGQTHYANAPQQAPQTIAARLLSGDPSAGQPTSQQDAFVNRLRYGMGLLRGYRPPE